MRRLASVLLILALLIIGGCSNSLIDNSGGSSDVSIMGTIENMKPNLGTILPVHVLLIEENPYEVEVFELANLTVIAETTVESNDTTYETYSYSFNEVPAGEYYVMAYKDLNGNGEIDVSEQGPIDAGGYYGLTEETEDGEIVVVSKGDTITGINFMIDSVAKTNEGNEQYDVALGSVCDAMTEENLAGIEVEIYGTAGIKVAESVITISSGVYYFPHGTIINGEYYLKVTKDGYLTYLSPLFIQTYNSEEEEYLLETYWSVLSGVKNYKVDVGASGNYPKIYMLSEEDAEDYGYSPDSSLIAGQVSIIFEGAEAVLNPASGEVGYIGAEGTINYELEGTQSDGEGWFVVKDVESGDYTITAAHDYDFYEYKLKVEKDAYTQLYLRMSEE